MNLIAWAIIACEALFWIVLLLGLVARYTLNKPKLGFALLALTPVIDLLLLAATGIDLYRGAVATRAHALAAVYISVSVIFGKSMIAWADERFRYYVLKQGHLPAKKYGMAYSVHYAKGTVKHALSFLLGAGILYGLVFLIDDPARTDALSAVAKTWALILGIDGVIMVTYFIWPRKAKGQEAA